MQEFIFHYHAFITQPELDRANSGDLHEVKFYADCSIEIEAPSTPDAIKMASEIIFSISPFFQIYEFKTLD